MEDREKGIRFYCIEEIISYCKFPTQVTIVDRDQREEQNLITRRNTQLSDIQPPLSDTGRLCLGFV